MTQPVVVGVDGSEAALLAVEWATEEARLRAAPLDIIHARSPDLPDGVAVPGMPGRPSEVDHILDRARRLARVRSPEVAVHTRLIDGGVLDVLLSAAARAQLIVVGARRHRPMAATLLGSLAGAVAARSPVATVVVRKGVGAATGRSGIVAGVDRDGTAASVLDFAFPFAVRHELPLRAVLVCRPTAAREALVGLSESPMEYALRWLDVMLQPWREQFPEVEAQASLVTDHPAAGLASAAGDQALLVVGRHGAHSHVTGFVGSVGQSVLHRATCPVVIVPEP